MDNEKLLTLKDCQLLMKKYLETEDFEVLAYQLISNEITDSYAVNIKASTKNVHREWQENLWKEILPYELIFKDLREKCPNFDINFLPTYVTKENLLIILADLSEQEFGLAENPFALNVEHIKVALNTLAKYHAGSLVFEEANSSELRLLQKYPVLQTLNGIFDSPWFQTRLKTLNGLIDLLPQNDQITHQQFKDSLGTFTSDAVEKIKLKNTFRNVLCQGYIGGDSILFRYCDGVPVDCKLMNFELPHYSPPAFDILQFIYMVTSTEVRQQHFHEFLQFYYDYLKAELHSQYLNADKIIPLEEEFEISIHHLLPIIKLQTVCFRQIQCLPKEFLQRIKTDSSLLFENSNLLVVEAFESDYNYRKLMTDSVLELRDLIIQPELMLEDCFQIIKNKIGTTNYELLNYKLLPIGNVSGFFGDHKKLKIDISVNNQKQTLNLFVKFTPKGKAQKSIADDCGSFYKENFFYRHFVPMVQRFGVTEINDCTVPCYFTRQDRVIIFEDFAIKNYGIINHRQSLSYEIVQLVVKQLAKFHACSIILEEKLGEQSKTKFSLKEHYDKELQESFFNKIPNHQGAKSMEISIEAIDHQMSLFSEFNSLTSNEDFKVKIKKAYEHMYELVKPSTEFRNAICHGDLWISNILMKKIDEELVDCRFIDFQIMRYCPPAHDLLGFIHLTTNRNFRKHHMDKVIKVYHNELSKVLSSYGYSIEKIYPYDNFLKSVEYMLPQAVCQTVMYYHICVGDPNLLKDYMASENMIKQIFLEDRRDFIEEMCKKDPIYRERNHESLEDLRDICFKYF